MYYDSDEEADEKKATEEEVALLESTRDTVAGGKVSPRPSLSLSPAPTPSPSSPHYRDTVAGGKARTPPPTSEPL